MKDNPIYNRAAKIVLATMLFSLAVSFVYLNLYIAALVYCHKNYIEIECGACGYAMPVTYTEHCVHCGAGEDDLYLVETYRCTECRKSYSSDIYKFCRECGAPVEQKKIPITELKGLARFMFNQTK